jgi:hypothetical protein
MIKIQNFEFDSLADYLGLTVVGLGLGQSLLIGVGCRIYGRNFCIVNLILGYGMLAGFAEIFGEYKEIKSAF